MWGYVFSAGVELTEYKAWRIIIDWKSIYCHPSFKVGQTLCIKPNLFFTYWNNIFHVVVICRFDWQCCWTYTILSASAYSMLEFNMRSHSVASYLICAGRAGSERAENANAPYYHILFLTTYISTAFLSSLIRTHISCKHVEDTVSQKAHWPFPQFLHC